MVGLPHIVSYRRRCCWPCSTGRPIQAAAWRWTARTSKKNLYTPAGTYNGRSCWTCITWRKARLFLPGHTTGVVWNR